MSIVGKDGLPGIAKICYENAQYAAEKLIELDSFTLKYNNRNFIKEFVLKTTFDVDKLINDASIAGFNLGNLSNDDSLLLAFTEQRSRKQIDNLVSFLSSYKQ